MPSLLESQGAQPRNPSRGKPIHIARLETGLFTNRSPLHDPAAFVISKFYGGYVDALIDGSNMEVSNALTLIRRPGSSQWSNQVVPTQPNWFYDWRTLDCGIKVVVDTATATYIQTPTIQTQIFTKSAGAGQGYYQGVADTLYYGDGVDLQKIILQNCTPGPAFNWGIVSPVSAPTVVVTPSGSAATQWQASTVWSTMGLIYNAASGTMLQLNSVNVSGINTTQFGTSGPGVPAAGWNNTFGGTTTDNTILWRNYGAIIPWTANIVVNNWNTNFSKNRPVAVYDSVTKALYVNIATQFDTNGGGFGTGSVRPNFKPGVQQTTVDNQCLWLFVGIPAVWTTNTAFPGLNVPIGNPVLGNFEQATITEPISLKYGLPSQPVYWQFVENGHAGTTAASGIAPFASQIPTGGTFIPAGEIVGDNGDLLWLSLGSGTWAASTAYSQWTASGTTFSAIVDTNNNFQVCATTGQSQTIQPGTSFTLSAAANASGGNTVYTGTFSPTIPSGTPVTISGFTNASNNGTFNVIGCTAAQLTVANTGGVAEVHAATALYNPWGTGYGSTTTDGTVVWTCVGNSMDWAANTKWFLPSSGFFPPSGSSPYGGASVLDSNGDIEFIINSGLGGSPTHPTWAAIGHYTADGGTPLTLTQVTVSGTTATYTGTITGGGGNALAGKTFLIAGFTNAGNNVLIQVTASTATTLVCQFTSQVNEVHAGTATTGAIWYNLEAQTPPGFAVTKSISFAYSYESRTATDIYNTTAPPDWPSPLGPPTGSETGGISTASPITTITGPTPASVFVLSMPSSVDPQVDTIVIWATLDGGSTLFFLTEIPNIPPVGGVAQTQTVTISQSPFTGTGSLNTFIQAPINHQNDPPPAGFKPMAYHFERIWGAVGNFVYASGGPDVLAGNPNEAFNPDDFFEFPEPVTRIVPTATGILVFLTSDVYAILGGPVFNTFFPTPMVPGIGLLHYNALDIHGGVIYLFTADSQFIAMDPSGGAQRMGGPIADKLAGFDPNKVFVTVHESGNDNAIFVSNGSTGWYRLNPSQFPNGTPVWSPFAAITGGAGAVLSIEVSPGVHRLLIGGIGANSFILQRDFSTYQDNGTSYPCGFTMGSINLVSPGQIAGLTFVNVRATRVGTTPACSFLLNEVSGSFTSFPQAQAYPWQVFGATGQPSSIFSNAYYFRAAGVPALAEHMQVQVNFPAENFANEVLSLTIFGTIEQSPEL